MSSVIYRLAIVMVNFRTAKLVQDSLDSFVRELSPNDRVVIVDNASGDGSDDRIEAFLVERAWGDRVQLIRSKTNSGFAAGNNLGIEALSAEFYLLLNSDTLVRPGAIEGMLTAIERHPAVGLLGPRLEWPDETPQNSSFRNISPISELIDAAATRPLTQILGRWQVAIGTPNTPQPCDWVSFACVLVRRQVFEKIGGLDEDFFLYFEDIEFSRRAALSGFKTLHDPSARVVHLRGGSSPVKSRAKERSRVNRYYYESRARYFGLFYGRLGLWLANLLWMLGRGLSFLRETIGGRSRHVAAFAWLDIWTGCLMPLMPLAKRNAKHQRNPS